MIQKELLEFFLTEADEHIGNLERGFLELDQNPTDTAGIQDLFRTAHTLKGSAALMKLNTLSKIAHKMEDILESIRDMKLPVTKVIVDWFLHSLDSIKYLISETASGRPEKEELLDEVCAALQYVLPENEEKRSDNGEDITEAGIIGSAHEDIFDAAGENSEKELRGNLENGIYALPASNEIISQENEPKPVFEPTEEKKATVEKRGKDAESTSTHVKVHIDSLDKMMGLVGELTILKNYFVSESEGVRNLRREIEYACKRLLKEIDDFDSKYAHSAPGKIYYIDSLLEDFRELEFDRYDGINLFANSIKEIMSDVSEATKSVAAFFDEFSKNAHRLDKLNLEFRDIISSSRMVETERLFQRFNRVIRDLCDRSGKQVRLVSSGGNTKIDRMLYERLFTPLLHLVRNAFSHGIENSEDRRQSGKHEEGIISLSAKRDGNSVIIDIQDDGRGIDLKKVSQKAMDMGIMKEGEDILQAQLLNILFMPGFTTHDGIDMTSGRGVGLDVVRQIIADINGTLSIATKEGKGTIFRIKLPLTLIVVNTVKFRAGGLDLSVPAGLIKELADISAAEYKKGKESIRLRDKEIPLKDLCALFNLNPVRTSTRIPVMVFNLVSGQEVALVVDEIRGQEDTVINPLGGFLEGLKYYSGFSISADSKLAPVINPTGLFEGKTPEVKIFKVSALEELKNNILVVDDSLSVRKFVGIILEQKGYNVLTASNGLDALNMIDENHVDLILTDLEMPVMHGYELLRELKRRGLSDVVPAIVLTSRSNEKHKEKAALLGAKDYLVKPFEELTLVETVRRHLKVEIASQTV